MKPTPSVILLAAISAATIGLTGCNKNTTVKEAAQDTATVAKDIASDVRDSAVSTWDTVKNYTFEKKSDFADAMERMAAKTDAEVDSLAAKSEPARDKAAEEYRVARAAFKIQLGYLREASAETWSATKDKTAEAWDEVQIAYKKVKASVAS